MGPALLIGLIFAGIGALVGMRLRSKINTYSKIPSQNGLSGREIAEKMLSDHGLRDVRIIHTPGQLTDHYNPQNRTVNLSEGVYQGRNAAAAAIAAHECGHAVQHATKYSMLQFRSALVPVQAISGKVLNIIILMSIFGGAFLFEAFPFDLVLWVVVAAYAVLTLFSFVTLPVEFDASNRALAWMSKSGMATQAELTRSKDALKWAAMTYVVAALASLTTLLYYVSLLAGRRSD